MVGKTYLWSMLTRVSGHTTNHKKWLRLFGQFLPGHKWCLAHMAYAATGRVGR